MNLVDTIRLLRKIKAYKPNQDMDEFTGEAWAEILTDTNAVDANAAVAQLAGELPYIGAHDVIKRVKHIRGQRIERGYADLVPPADLTPREAIAWDRDSRRRLGDGETAAEINGGQPELIARDMSSLPQLLTRVEDVA